MCQHYGRRNGRRKKMFTNCPPEGIVRAKESVRTEKFNPGRIF
jgi:hypothetical protein